MNEIEKLWDKNRPLFIAIVVAIGVVAYVVYKRTQASLVPILPTTPAAAPASSVGPGGTFINTYDTTTINNPPAPPTPGPRQPPPPPPPPPRKGPVQTVFPAPKGTLHPSPPGAGNNDTNWYPAVIPARMTLQQAAMQMAKWSSATQLYNYRNNAAIFAQMGVANNPGAMVVPGWSISV